MNVLCKLGLHRFVNTMIPQYSVPFDIQEAIKTNPHWVEERKLYLKQLKPIDHIPWRYCVECGKPDLKFCANISEAIAKEMKEE